MFDLFAVDQKMAVPDKMPALGAGVDESQSIHHIVQPAFQHHQQVGAGNPFLPVRPLKNIRNCFSDRPYIRLTFCFSRSWMP